VAFVPDVTAAFAAPFALYPDGAGMRRTIIVATNPDVTAAVPAVVAANPDPIAVGAGGSGDDFDGTRWGRPDADDQLCIRGSGGEKDGCGGCEKVVFHVHPLLLCS
jgi:hypothetical protein